MSGFFVILNGAGWIFALGGGLFCSMEVGRAFGRRWSYVTGVSLGSVECGVCGGLRAAGSGCVCVCAVLLASWVVESRLGG